jgi:hypothetical protein
LSDVDLHKLLKLYYEPYWVRATDLKVPLPCQLFPLLLSLHGYGILMDRVDQFSTPWLTNGQLVNKGLITFLHVVPVYHQQGIPDGWMSYMGSCPIPVQGATRTRLTENK